MGCWLFHIFCEIKQIQNTVIISCHKNTWIGWIPTNIIDIIVRMLESSYRLLGIIWWPQLNSPIKRTSQNKTRKCLTLIWWVIDGDRTDGTLMFIIHHNFIHTAIMRSIFIHGSIQWTNIILISISLRELTTCYIYIMSLLFSL